MKKLLVAAIAVASAASVLAQGTITFNIAPTTTVKTRIYAPLATSGDNMYVHQIGNGAADAPVGTTSWAGYNLIGASGTAFPAGSAVKATLYFALGTGATEASLTPANNGGIATFRTSTANTTSGAAGLIATVSPTYNIITSDNYAGGGTVEYFVWDDSAAAVAAAALVGINDISVWGTVGSKNAEDAWLGGAIAAGKSGLINITAPFGGFGSPSPTLPPNLTGISSFNIYYIPVPEPGTFALVGLGAAALLIFRRRK